MSAAVVQRRAPTNSNNRTTATGSLASVGGSRRPAPKRLGVTQVQTAAISHRLRSAVVAGTAARGSAAEAPAAAAQPAAASSSAAEPPAAGVGEVSSDWGVSMGPPEDDADRPEAPGGDTADFSVMACVRRHAKGITKPAPKDPRAVLTVFVTHPSTVIILVSVCGLLALRLQHGFQLMDIAAVLATSVLWLAQEWVIHAKLLHSSFDWFGKQIHEDHHREDYHHISLDPPGLIAGVMLLAGSLFCLLLPLPVGLTATLTYFSMGLLYEFSHYAVHTKYTPTHPFARRIRQHHMLHHNRNYGNWLSFTVPSVDDLMGTNPPPASVPRAVIARRSGGGPH